MCDDLKIKHPFTLLVSGAIKSGNSSFSIRFLEKHETLCTVHTFVGGVTWCSSEKSAVPSGQMAGTKNVRSNDGLPAEFDNAKDKRCLIILDDLLNEA